MKFLSLASHRLGGWVGLVEHDSDKKSSKFDRLTGRRPHRPQNGNFLILVYKPDVMYINRREIDWIFEWKYFDNKKCNYDVIIQPRRGEFLEWKMPEYQHSLFCAYTVQHTPFSGGRIVKVKKVLFRYCFRSIYFIFGPNKDGTAKKYFQLS